MMRKGFYHQMAAAVAIALAMALCLLGCGGSSKNAAPMPSSAAAATAPPAEPSPPRESFQTDQIVANADGESGGEMDFVMPDSRKIIRRASMELETREFDNALLSIQQAVAAAGGYIESQNQSGYSYGSSRRYQERYANISARVPSEKLDGVIRSVGGL